MSYDANMYSEAISIDPPPYNHVKSVEYKFNRRKNMHDFNPTHLDTLG